MKVLEGSVDGVHYTSNNMYFVRLYCTDMYVRCGRMVLYWPLSCRVLTWPIHTFNILMFILLEQILFYIHVSINTYFESHCFLFMNIYLLHVVNMNME